MAHYVVVGASHAGISFAEKMRQLGSTDEITLIDKLTGVPMQRPPLSKAYLASESDEESQFHLRAEEWFAANQITLRDGVLVSAIARDDKQLHLSDGTSVSYDKLILALGAYARDLPAAQKAVNHFVLRDGDDARALKATLPHAKTAIVVGGGYIGLEAAASLRKQGLGVHLIEAAPRLLARVASPQISEIYKELHESHDVCLHIGSGLNEVHYETDRVTGVTLSNGTRLACDLLLVGIGVVPETDLASQAGLAVGNGIITDFDYKTSDDDIYAIGDNVLAKGRGDIRIESIHNAQYSAHYIASAFTNAAKPHDEAPWFWSDQFDRKLQSAGLVPAPCDDVVQVSRPGKREGGISVWSFKADTLCAVESVNDPQAYMIGKICLEKGVSPQQTDIADLAFDLKSLR